MQYNAAALRALASIYRDHFGLSYGQMSRQIAGRTSSQLIASLLWGERDQAAATQLAISRFLDRCWPEDLPWPVTVPRQDPTRGWVIPALRYIPRVGLQYTTAELAHLIRTLVDNGAKYRRIDAAVDHPGLTHRLMRGENCRAKACRKLSDHFNATWPKLGWPAMVPRDRGNRWVPARRVLVPLFPLQPRVAASPGPTLTVVYTRPDPATRPDRSAPAATLLPAS